MLTIALPLAAQPMEVPEPTEATRRHLAARRTTGKIRLDGRLDESDWQRAPAAGDFSQARPDYIPTTRFPTTSSKSSTSASRGASSAASVGGAMGLIGA